ncbi:hypothetical protein K701_29425 [Streptomyces fradiae ATCC 10745 = DSM 40063]|uniref:Uncharacterized protein n=1 Tax=Streptomyces fradiae ATCC 10745 = DSM 40063 TaxID=1319510 RepID=A0ABQ6XKI1_STRFR|nr:hypothetical protein K701_29425 [Streptomyces fradiae ATCC 10745 = DSM 40063]
MIEQLGAGVPLVEAARRAGTTSKRVRSMAAINPRVAALLAAADDKRLVRQVVAHLVAVATGEGGDPQAEAWRMMAPRLADVELAVSRGPEALARVVEQRRLLEALAQGAPTLKAASTRAGIAAARLRVLLDDGEFAQAAVQAQAAATRRVVEQALVEIAEDRDVEGFLAAAGVGRQWLTDQARGDLWVARALAEARERRRDLRAAARAAARKGSERRRSSRADARAERKADTVQQDRARLARLLPLLEEGATVGDALAAVGSNASWLSRVRRRVPEAEQQVKAACAAGRGKRPSSTVVRPSSGPAVRDARARQEVVAAVASGGTLKQAATRIGTVPAWVLREYHRVDGFREALRAAAALHPEYDLDADLKRAARGNVQRVPAPRLPDESTPASARR